MKSDSEEYVFRLNFKVCFNDLRQKLTRQQRDRGFVGASCWRNSPAGTQRDCCRIHLL